MSLYTLLHQVDAMVPSLCPGSSQQSAMAFVPPQYAQEGFLPSLRSSPPAPISVKKLEPDPGALLYSHTVMKGEANQPVDEIHFGLAVILSVTVKTCDHR